MKAIRIHEIGGPEVMRWEDVPLPEPGAGQVRIRHTAVALNFRDILVRRGQHAAHAMPSGLGTEGVGTIEALGPGVTDFAVGDRVACVAGPDGAYCEARVVPAARVVKLPGAIDERTAAAMMVRGMTARYLLHATYKVKPGDTIVIHAAAGGVGLIVSQWAKHLGATVIGTVGSDDKEAVARAHGCDHVLRYDRFRAARARDRRRQGRAGGLRLGRARDLRGVAQVPGPARHPGVVRRVLRRPAAGVGARSRQHGLAVRHPSEPAATTRQRAPSCWRRSNDLFAMVAGGKIRIEVNRSYPLREAAQAHRDVEGRKTTGSVVLIP
jgi:NADPH:quinone reductase